MQTRQKLLGKVKKHQLWLLPQKTHTNRGCGSGREREKEREGE